MLQIRRDADGRLVIEATADAETIRIANYRNAFDQVEGVRITAQDSHGRETTRIIKDQDAHGLQIHGGQGNDRIEVDEEVTYDLRLDGGQGNDVLIGSKGTTLISGGEGRDHHIVTHHPAKIYGIDGYRADTALNFETGIDPEDTIEARESSSSESAASDSPSDASNPDAGADAAQEITFGTTNKPELDNALGSLAAGGFVMTEATKAAKAAQDAAALSKAAFSVGPAVALAGFWVALTVEGTANPWQEQKNPITGEPYRTQEEYEFVQLLNPSQRKALKNHNVTKVLDEVKNVTKDPDNGCIYADVPRDQADEGKQGHEADKFHNGAAAHVTGSQFDHLVISPDGSIAKFDGRKPGTNEVWELKTSKPGGKTLADRLSSTDPQELSRAQDQLTQYDKQRVRHKKVAQECSCELRYGSTSERLADFLNEHWGHSPPPVEPIQYPPQPEQEPGPQSTLDSPESTLSLSNPSNVSAQPVALRVGERLRDRFAAQFAAARQRSPQFAEPASHLSDLASKKWTFPKSR